MTRDHVTRSRWRLGLIALTVSAILLLCMSARAQTADSAQQAYPLDEDGFVRDWLVGGPYPNPQGEPESEGFAKDLLAHLGGEANLLPYAGMSDEATFVAEKAELIAGAGATNEWGFTETRTIPVTWQPLHWEDESPIISLDGRFGEIHDWLAAFAACWIQSPTDRTVHFRIGSDDGYKLYVNHELLGGLSIARAADRDQNVHPGQLHKGLNLILLKVTDRTGNHAFCLRITDSRGRVPDDLRVVLERPRLVLAARCENLDEVDVVDGKGFAKIRLGSEPRFPGTMKLLILAGLTEAKTGRVDVRVKDGSGREVFTDTVTSLLSPTKAFPIDAQVQITEPGQASVTVLVRDAESNAILARLSRTFEVLDVRDIRRRRFRLRRELAERRKQKAELEARLAELSKMVASLRRAIAGQYERIEALYIRRRKVLQERYGSEGRSINEPFAPAQSPREVICLNGDGWEIAGATSVGPYKIDDENPPEDGWEPGWVPMMGVEKYFRSRFFPARGDRSPYGPTKVLKCAPAGWKLSDARIGEGIWYRTVIEMPERWNGRRVFFNTEYAFGRLKVFLDGQLCGTHTGWPGEVNIQLGALPPGRHELLVLVQRPRSYGGITPVERQFFGLVGDVYLTTCSDVMVTDAWVMTSWRNATIEARVWLCNNGKQKRTVSVDCRAVLKGRTRLRLGSSQVQLPPGVIREVRLVHPWTDAQVWGIGGEYGNPTLYHLVTTVTDENGLLDQHFTRFGFREFWKEGFHFYLNGKRLFIQGDNVGARISSRPEQVVWQHLLRETCNVNTIRTHFEFQQGMYARVADELGMLLIPQWYPILHVKGSKGNGNALSVEEFLTTREHRENLRLYANWVKWLRNHPSVIIYSTDNEIFTQAWDTPEKLEVNIRNDRLGALYGQYVKALDPTRLVTRDGDEGTWGKMGKWQEDPPADIANYHYPDFDTKRLVENWESLYERPVLFGETLYCSYGAWDGWIDAIPSQVSAKAQRCRTVLSLYRDLEIPGWVGMGPGLDCFTELKQDGSGNPWGVTPAMQSEYKANGQIRQWPRYPYFPIQWPSLSGPGLKPEFHRFLSIYGYGSVNAFFDDLPVCVQNAVNDAYKQSTRPMPPLAAYRPTEVLITITEAGRPLRFATVLLTPKGGQVCPPTGVRSDSQGRAWFVLEEPGTYQASVDGKAGSMTIKLEPISFDMKAGFDYLPRVNMEVGQ